MKRNYDEVARNAALKGAAPSSDTNKPRHDWSYKARNDRLLTGRVSTHHAAEAREGMPWGHDARKSFIHTRSYAPMKRERKRR